jgi:poly(hydroxyalkanoate) depolymerase family esterase
MSPGRAGERSPLIAGTFANDRASLSYWSYRSRNARRRPPLFVMLHGARQSAEDFASITHMNDVADECGGLVLYPEQSTLANPLACWNWYDREQQFAAGGEPSLIVGATRQFAATHEVNPSQIYVAGMSGGGAMAVILGDAHPDLFAAVGVHSGLPLGAANDFPSALKAMTSGPGASYESGTGSREGGRRQVRTIAFHGDQDTTVHPANGHAILDQACSRGTGRLLTGWLTSERISAPGGSDITRVRRFGDPGVVLAELWVIHGGVHVWSGGSQNTGNTDTGPDASREMARFFLKRFHAPAWLA